jgi:hypothetical protein
MQAPEQCRWSTARASSKAVQFSPASLLFMSQQFKQQPELQVPNHSTNCPKSKHSTIAVVNCLLFTGKISSLRTY